eukprot:3858680-Amphidinium_carterae.1
MSEPTRGTGSGDPVVPVAKRARMEDKPERGRAGMGGRDQKRLVSDGRYFRNADGNEICFNWSRSPNGCSDPCIAARAHICEWCRKPHRTIDCPLKPGWSPPSAAETAAKGRTRKK